MEGKQREIYTELKYILNKIQDGEYGEGDDVDEIDIEFDLGVFMDDFLNND